VKYDGVASDRGNAKTLHLRQLLGIRPDELVWVAGSTQTPEEEYALAIYRKARERFPNLRLILVPRQKDRFDGVAQMLERSGAAWLRRSALAGDHVDERVVRALNEERPILLIDTIGELGAIWGLADVAFVGGSLDGQRGGQNMIEPAAYGAALTFGPHTWNFKETVARLKELDAAIEVQDAADMEQTTLDLLGNAGKRIELGGRARDFVLSQQGATKQSVEALEALVAGIGNHVSLAA
jgi:3-deoxy-D-manno-octulosonic-acid transferase